MASKTWKELLGSCTYMCGVDGTDICRHLGHGRYVRLWSFETTEQAIEALKAWRKELGED